MLECTPSAYELLVAQNQLSLQNSASQEGWRTMPPNPPAADLNQRLMEGGVWKCESEIFSHSVMCNCLWPPGLYLCPWIFPGKNTGVGCHSLLQGIFPTQGLNLGLLHCVGRFFTVCATREGTPNTLHLWWNSSQVCILFTAWVFPEDWVPVPYHGLWGFPGGSEDSACNAGDPGSIPGLGRSSAERKGYPLQYSCLENSMDREAWWVTVHGVARIGYDLVTNTFTFTVVSGWTMHPLLPAFSFLSYFFIPPWMLPGIISQMNCLHLNHVLGIYFWGIWTKRVTVSVNFIFLFWKWWPRYINASYK